MSGAGCRLFIHDPLDGMGAAAALGATAEAGRRRTNRASPSLLCGSRSHSAPAPAKSICRSFAPMVSGARKRVSTSAPSCSAIWRWLAGMMAVCGSGRRSGRLNKTTTAYQSARPPIVAASAKAARKPKPGLWRSRSLARTRTARTRNQNTVGKQFGSPELAQSRAITLIEHGCAEHLPPFVDPAAPIWPCLLISRAGCRSTGHRPGLSARFLL